MAQAVYRTLFPLAAGGMGSVELVLQAQPGLRRVCARKRLLPHLRGDAQFRAMFLDEARLASTLAHQNIVAVLDVGDDQDGPFLVMEHVRGVSAARLIDEANERDDQLPIQIALRIGLEAAFGLHAAHEARDSAGRPLGVVHRDVSPMNLLVGFAGAIKVTDFGIAKAFGNSSHTTTGVLKGNIGYLAPEVLRFEPADRRSDLFALGVTLYELLTGRRLYAANEDGARRILNAPPPDLLGARPDAPPALVELMFDLLAKEPSHRPASADEVAGRLEEVMAGVIAREGPFTVAEYLAAHFAQERDEAEARVANALTTIGSSAHSRRRAWGAAALVAVALAGGLAFVRHKGAGAPAGAALLEAGGFHTCARDGNALHCWGKNSDGQIGHGGTLDSSIRRPVSIPPVTALGLGAFHSCACVEDGRAFCWGRNDHGQLGLGTTGPSVTEPTLVPGLLGCRAIAAGEAHTCAVRADGAALCWGRNHTGQVGMPRSERQPTPRVIDGVRGAIGISAAGRFACAVLGDGHVQCWGQNSNGGLGDGTRTDRFTAAFVQGLDDAVEIDLAEWTACARRRGGAVLCWGRRSARADDSAEHDDLTPAPVPALLGARQLAVGIDFVCAMRAAGDVACFGRNTFGQLGVSGAGRPQDAPAVIPALNQVWRVAAGSSHMCARHAGGIACWGLNQTGQLGDGMNVDRSSPVSVSGFGQPAL